MKETYKEDYLSDYVYIYIYIYIYICAVVKLLSRAQLYDPMDCSLLGSSVHAIFQARVLEWVAISFLSL